MSVNPNLPAQASFISIHIHVFPCLIKKSSSQHDNPSIMIPYGEVVLRVICSLNFSPHKFLVKYLGVCGYIVTKYKMVAVILIAKQYKYSILLRFTYAKMWIGILRSLGFKQLQYLYIFLPVLSFIMLWSVALSLVLSYEKWPRSL